MGREFTPTIIVDNTIWSVVISRQEDFHSERLHNAEEMSHWKLGKFNRD